MAVERTLVLVKPDAVKRGLCGEIIARLERRGLRAAGRQARPGRREAGRRPLRRAPWQGLLRGARLLHHLGPDAGAGRRGRVGGSRRPLDHGRDRPGQGRRPGRSAAISASRCPTTSCTAPTRRSRRHASWRSGSPDSMKPSELPDYAARNRALWSADDPQPGRIGSPQLDERGDSLGSVRRPRESRSSALPGLDGTDAIELGCGTAYFSAWLAQTWRARRRRRPEPGPARAGTALPARVRARVPARSRPTPRTYRSPTPRSTWRSRSTAPASGAIPTGGSPRRSGCCARAAGSSSCATRRCSILCSDADGPRAGEARAPAGRAAPPRLGGRRRRGQRLPALPRRLDRPAARERLRDRAPDRAVRAGGGEHALRTGTSSAPTGRGRWPAEEIWVARKP